VRRRGGILPAGYRRAQEIAGRIAEALPLTDPVPCHNDLLCSNLMAPDGGGVMLVDWEYAGLGDRLFDLGNFAVNNEFEVSGLGAAELLERLCDNRVARSVGAITYTQMLNRRGGIECDFTVTRVEDELFQIVTGTAFGNHDASWIRNHLPEDGSVRLSDVTSRWATFALWGPQAVGILAPLTPDPLDFPYMSMREIAVADVPVRALRVTFVGEMGWELYCPTEYGLGLWKALWEAGQPHGVRACGYRAIDSLRLEKGYRVWAADITPDETPYEGGLGFCVREDKDFIGAEALRAGGVERRLRCLVLEDSRSVALGNEPVRIDGSVCGRVTSGGYGYTVERSIAYAYLPAEIAPGAAIEVDIFGRWVAGEVAAEPLFDPSGERVRRREP
jgi:glycine cleavage system aminomethyltransferase T